MPYGHCNASYKSFHHRIVCQCQRRPGLTRLIQESVFTRSKDHQTLTIQGARFGPRAIRAASSRQTSFRGFNARAGLNPYTSWARIIDCGDIPVTPFDNALALTQMTAGYTELLSHPPSSSSSPSPYFQYPKLITLGGDHSLALPALRALVALHKEPLAVLHFDSHLDTCMFLPRLVSPPNNL
jgi:arginase family enzyme